MNSLEALAQKISNKATEEGEYGIDPVTIGIIITIMTNLVKLWWACKFDKSKESIRSELHNPSWIFKLLLRREIRKQADRQSRTSLYGAFIDVAPTLTDEEIDDIIKQIGDQ